MCSYENCFIVVTSATEKKKKKKSITKAFKILYYINTDRKRGNTKSVRWLWTAWTDIAAAPCWRTQFDLTSAENCQSEVLRFGLKALREVVIQDILKDTAPDFV